MFEEIPKNINLKNEIKAKVIGFDKWNEEMSKLRVSRQDMNKLVLNYLIIEGYKDAVEKFIKETGINCTYNAELLDKRMKVRHLIISGKIDESINEINDINSEILENNPSIHFELQKQKLIEIIKQNKIEDALVFAQNKLFPITQNNESLLSELEKIMVLLAYDDIGKSPYKELGTVDQLKKLASIINLEILSAQMQPTGIYIILYYIILYYLL